MRGKDFHLKSVAKLSNQWGPPLYSKFIPNLTRRDGSAFLKVFGEKMEGLAPKNLPTFCQPFQRRNSAKPQLSDLIGGAGEDRTPDLKTASPLTAGDVSSCLVVSVGVCSGKEVLLE